MDSCDLHTAVRSDNFKSVAATKIGPYAIDNDENIWYEMPVRAFNTYENLNIKKHECETKIKKLLISGFVGKYIVALDSKNNLRVVEHGGFSNLFENPKIVLEENIEQFDVGWSHIVALTANGNILSFGLNDCGQIGFKKPLFFSDVFKPLKLPNKIISISCGENHSGFLDEFGKIWMCGDNEMSQLGINTEKYIDEPTVTFENNIVDFSCSGDHTMLIDNNSKLWVSGNNSCGQLGMNLENISKWSQVSDNVSFLSVYSQKDFAVLRDCCNQIWFSGSRKNVYSIFCNDEKNYTEEKWYGFKILSENETTVFHQKIAKF